LAPLGFWRARRALAPAADGEARLRLAEFAVHLGLHAEAREEYEKAYGLGAIGKEAYQRQVREAERDAVRNGLQRARKLADAGDLEGAMEIARRLKLEFANAPQAAEVGKLVAELVARVRELDEEAVRARTELERVLLGVKREKEIQLRATKARARTLEAGALLPAWEAALEIGNMTRLRKNAEAADALFQEARVDLGRLRRILPADHEARREVLADLTRLDAAQFDLRFRTARCFADGRIWTRAEHWLHLASYIDPVHPDLLELREEITASRIRYRASDITNARGRTTGR
jgi:hypothetical protein